MPWRSHRIPDRGSRGTIPYPPTPHHDRAKADNDRDQDRQDSNSCIILTLPVAEWVSCCAAGFERHTSSDRKLSHAGVIHTRMRKGRNSWHHPRLLTGVDRRQFLPLVGWTDAPLGCGLRGHVAAFKRPLPTS